MRAQEFEQTLLDIVKTIDAHLGDPLETGVNADRKDRSNDRMILTKIRRMAAKATDRSK
jgi:uncharacterized protein Veg